MISRMNYKQYCQLVILIVLACCYELKAQILQTPDWEILDNMSYSGGTLKPASGTSATTWCRAGSKSKLEKDEYGHIIVKSLGTTGDQYIGFSELPYQYRNQESKYSLRFTSWGQIYLFVDGLSQGKIFPPTGSTNLEDYEVKLAKESGAIRIYVKGPLDGSFSMVKEHLVSSSYMPMWVYSNMFGNASGFEPMETTIPEEHHPVSWNLRETSGPTNNYGQARTYDDWKGGGVLSTQKLPAGKQGALSYVVRNAETSSYWIGFSSANGLDRSDQIDYGFEFVPGGILKAYCNGVMVDQSTYAVGSTRKARVIINEGQVDFYYGNTALYRQVISDPNLEFRVALLFGSSGQAFDEVKTSLTFNVPEWDYKNGVSFTEGGTNVLKTNLTPGWNSSFASTAISTARLKNVYMEAVSTDRHIKFIGIPFDHTDMNHISDFRNGFFVGNDGTKVTIFSTDNLGTTTSTLFDIADPDGDGNSVTNSTYYLYGNKMGIRVSETKIYFYYNNVLIHSEDFEHNSEVDFGGMLYEGDSGFKLLRYGIEETFEESKVPNWDYVKGMDRYLDSGFTKGENASLGLNNSISVSENVLVEGEYTSIHISSISGNGIKRFGLTNGMLPGSVGNSDLYFEVDDSQQLIIQDGLATTTNLGQVNPEDVFSIENRDNVIHLKKNGRYFTVLRNHALTNDTFRLFTQLEKEGARIGSIKTSGDGEAKNIYWTSDHKYSYDSDTDLLSSDADWISTGIASDWVSDSDANARINWTNILSSDTYYAGFARQSIQSTVDNIDFALRVTSSGNVSVYENGTFIKELSTSLSANDELAMERVNGKVNYLINNIVAYESALRPSSKLYPVLRATVASQNLPVLESSYNNSPGKWEQLESISYDPIFKNFTSKSDTSNWVVSAISANVLKTNTDSYLSFRASVNSSNPVVVALIDAADATTLNSVNPTSHPYSFYINDKARIYESGTEVWSDPSFNEGDEFRIEKVSTLSGYEIRYFKNDVQEYTSALPTDVDMVAAIRMRGKDARLYDVNLGFPYSLDMSRAKNGYAQMSRKSTGAYQKSVGRLLFGLDESFVYHSPGDLSYKILYGANTELACGTIPQLTDLGARKFALDISSFCIGKDGVQDDKVYTLVVENKKQEKRYLRFKYLDPK